MKGFLFFICLMTLGSSCTSEDESGSSQELAITPNVGLGVLSFSDNGHKVIQEFGMYKNITVIRSAGDAAFVMWYENGLAFQLDYIDTKGFSLQEVLDMASELIDLDQNIIQMIVMPPAEASTIQGIGIGSSQEEVIAAYGEPTEIISSTERYEGINLNFWYNTSQEVKRIDLFQ